MRLIKLLSFAAILASLNLSAQIGRISSNGEVLPSIADNDAARQAEARLLAGSADIDLLGQLLDFYNQRWEQADLQAARLRIILWTIANHPDIELAGRHDPRGLIVNPDDKQDYTRVRAAWLDQVARNPRNSRVLANAARYLRLTDREAAANWLKEANQVSDLADVYADAICGITGMNPWEGPTSVDAAETQSPFAREARDAAMRDAELAARTGWAIYLCSEALDRTKLSAADYDPIAEKLLIQAANLDYPNPSRVPLLGVFYRRQQRKASGRLIPKWPVIDVPPEEQDKRLIEKLKQVVFADANFHNTVTVPVKIEIGIDGHVWKSEALGAPQIAGPIAAGSADNWTYSPLRLNDEPVCVSTIVQVTVEPLQVPR